MRILICSVSAALGGMERRIEAETRLLTELGHEVLVATTRFPGLERWKSDIGDAGGRYVDWRPYKFVERQHFVTPFRWLALATLPALRRQRIDFAHIAMPWNFVGLSMAYVLSRAKIPFVVGIHCKFGRQALPERGRPFVLEAMSGLVGGYAVSDPVNDSFMRLYAGLLPKSARMETILNGIDIGRFRPDAAARLSVRQSLGFDDRHFVVVFCGRIDSMKRPLFALGVFARFAAKYPKGLMLIVGDGPETAALKSEIASLGIENRVTLTGQVPNTAPYYAASDCYLSTSTNQEGCPLAAAEALASGLPAIVPNDDVFSSIYGGCNAVQRCDPSDLDSWDNALLYLASLNEEFKLILTNGAQEFAKTTLAADIMNARLALFYQKISASL
jgi:glycosyltransferase involved in cell wall biosynthesis